MAVLRYSRIALTMAVYPRSRPQTTREALRQVGDG
jgi:hypothetical protein